MFVHEQGCVPSLPGMRAAGWPHLPCLASPTSQSGLASVAQPAEMCLCSLQPHSGPHQWPWLVVSVFCCHKQPKVNSYVHVQFPYPLGCLHNMHLWGTDEGLSGCISLTWALPGQGPHGNGKAFPMSGSGNWQILPLVCVQMLTVCAKPSNTACPHTDLRLPPYRSPTQTTSPLLPCCTQ